MHPRRAIREAIRTQLVGKTAAADRVFTSRIAPIGGDADELPAILIYTRDEKIDPEHGYGVDGADSYTRRGLKVVVEGIVKGGETVDDKLDDLAEQIEAALEDWIVPGFEGAKVRLVETEIDVVTQDVRFPLGAIGLVYDVLYFRAWRPDTTVGPTITEVDRILWGEAPVPVVP